MDDIPSNPADPTTYKFAGSSLIIVADSRADVVELIKKDIYTETGVWDVEKVHCPQPACIGPGLLRRASDSHTGTDLLAQVCLPRSLSVLFGSPAAAEQKL